MVFAVWAAPEPAHPELLELEDALVESLRAARAEPEQLAFESAERYGYPAGFLARYFEKLRYRFGPRERAVSTRSSSSRTTSASSTRCPSCASSAQPPPSEHGATHDADGQHDQVPRRRRRVAA